LIVPITTDDLYGARSKRPTRAQYEARRAALYAIVEEQQPMNVRHAFYLATVRGLVLKTDRGTGNGYSRIQWDLTVLRKSGEMPFEWIEDGTRAAVAPRTYPNIAAALQATARRCRKSLWEDADCRVQIWIEKDGLTNVIYPVTGERDVSVWPARGYSSLTFLYDAASSISAVDVPTYIYQIGDSDPSGENAGVVIERTLREMAPYSEIIFERLAVTEVQIADWNLTSRPTKQSDPRAKRFGDRPSVELEAIEPNRLRELVREAIERHMPPDQLEELKQAEEHERATLLNMVKKMTPKRKQ
jgi:hypothetical protein